MKLISIWKPIQVSGLIVAAVSVVVLFQNCSKVQFGIDDASKENIIAKDGVFHDPGDDTKVPDGRDPGDDGPSNPRDPGDDNPDGPRDPGEDSMILSVSYMCSDMSTEKVGTTLLEASSVKLVVKSASGQVVKEVSANIKEEILNKKQIDMAPVTSGLASGKYDVYLLPAGASDVKKQNMLMTSGRGNARITVEVNGDKAAEVSMKPQSSKGLFVLYDVNAQASDGESCDRRQSPLIIHLAEKETEFTGFQLSSPLAGVQFDILGERSFPYAHAKKQISWLTNAESYYFVALPNEQGEVKGANELFGNNTRGPDGRFASNGYKALAKYDQDRDKMITPADEVYSSLRLWRDDNLDGVAQSNELYSLESKSVVAIDLRYDRRYREEDQYGNRTMMKSVVQTSDGKLHLIFDLWFRYLNISE
ncbi:hypothetical protein D3C72_1112210 [compost metagenome]